MNYKIVIDPGHGGSDPGASGNGIIEKNLTLEISKEMYKLFKSLGIPVYMTRFDDATINPKDRTKKVLDAFGNDPNVIVISNHINAGGGTGAEVIYALRNNATLPNLIAEEIKKTGMGYRKSFQRTLPKDPSKDYYYMHRNTGKTQSIIVEYGFLDSPGKDPYILKTKYKELAHATVKGVCKYINYSYQNDNVYIVKKGDSLWSISKMFNTTIDAIKQANNLTSNMINANQRLIIPKGNQIVHTVVHGDSLWSISVKYNVSINELKSYNNLTSNVLYSGQKIKIPNNNRRYNMYNKSEENVKKLVYKK
ncbi:MAG: LysM peptidoglycan-binding domain-containing protein [Bacilli bacterium]|nr:LysM peptidoglycan-binding domain-containing protein [Bacilli bacterium]